MAKSVFEAPQFLTEESAFTYVEAHLWPNGSVCPHCGNCDSARIRKMTGKTTRMGLYKCNECRKPFTVRMGTIFEGSHLPLHIWLQVIHLMCASKKGISTRQVQRMLSCSMKTAWFLTHRIREAMRADIGGMFGSGGTPVEVDETYFGRKEGVEKAVGGHRHKLRVVSLIDRATGQARSIDANSMVAGELAAIVRENVAKEARLMTDEANAYKAVGREFASHECVFHGIREYARGDVTTNTVEGFFSIFKRGMKGVYQHCNQKHLHRYLAEFDFRYSNRVALGCNDSERASVALRGVVGKRLTYQTTGGAG